MSNPRPAGTCDQRRRGIRWASAPTDVTDDENLHRRYRVAFTDWLACAANGAGERAAQAIRAAGDDLLSDVAFAATAGHVLDFDDTFADGVAHVSATCAPAALILAARLGRSLETTLIAYAEGFEAMAAVAAESHPALYDAGWHPTAVCGPIGAAVAAARLLKLTPVQRDNALALAVLRAGGTRAAFGSDAKSIQVGLASAAGVQAALIARGGASVAPRAVNGPLGVGSVVGVRWPGSERSAGDGRPAIERNWIKLYPSCLGTHAAIEAAVTARDAGYRLQDGRLEVRVHTVARQAAHLDAVPDGLSAKFSIPYCVAYTLRHGPPGVRDFAAVDRFAADHLALVSVAVDDSLPEFGAVLAVDGNELARVPYPKGTPQRGVSDGELADKLAELTGDRLTRVLDDLHAPAAAAVEAAALGPSMQSPLHMSSASC